jgi:hypothetical protein
MTWLQLAAVIVPFAAMAAVLLMRVVSSILSAARSAWAARGTRNPRWGGAARTTRSDAPGPVAPGPAAVPTPLESQSIADSDRVRHVQVRSEMDQHSAVLTERGKAEGTHTSPVRAATPSQPLKAETHKPHPALPGRLTTYGEP